MRWALRAPRARRACRRLPRPTRRRGATRQSQIAWTSSNVGRGSVALPGSPGDSRPGQPDIEALSALSVMRKSMAGSPPSSLGSDHGRRVDRDLRPAFGSFTDRGFDDLVAKNRPATIELTQDAISKTRHGHCVQVRELIHVRVLDEGHSCNEGEGGARHDAIRQRRTRADPASPPLGS